MFEAAIHHSYIAILIQTSRLLHFLRDEVVNSEQSSCVSYLCILVGMIQSRPDFSLFARTRLNVVDLHRFNVRLERR